MNFRTEIRIEPTGFEIDHRTGIVAVGSCFAENMARRLERARFRVTANPFGVMFNPASAADCLLRLLDGKPFTAEELSTDGERWFSYAHHGSFSADSAEEVLLAINLALDKGSRALREAGAVIVTLGTAWVYERQGRVAANCHRTAASEFVRRRMSIEETVGRLGEVVERLAGKRFILTVSPVRHLRDGLAANALSKAILRVAAEATVEKYGNVRYFPAYEIVTDDLRDYRFYAEDMRHPSPQAIDYIWDKFCAAAMTPATIALAAEVEKIVAAAAHRPLHKGSISLGRFASGMSERCRALTEAYPELDLAQETEYFEKLL
jgi:hypothetical protein